jgi:hypothetical protein
MHEIWTASNDMTFISNFVQVSLLVQKLKRMYKQQGALKRNVGYSTD